MTDGRQQTGQRVHPGLRAVRPARRRARSASRSTASRCAIVRTGGEVFALRDVCSHAEVPLSEGEMNDHTVECWLHGSCFDLRTGKPTGLPATEPVPIYPVKIEGDDVYVALS